MAGSYPNAESRKIAYDEDGTVVMYKTNVSGGWNSYDPDGQVFMSAANKIKFNDTEVGGIVQQNTNNGNLGVIFYFPEPRDIKGLYFWNQFDVNDTDWLSITNVWYSTDSTNGIDGTWTDSGILLRSDLGDIFEDNSGYTIDTTYRSQIIPVDWQNVRSWKYINDADTDIVSGLYSIHACHVYGVIDSAYSGDRIAIYDNDTGAEFTLPQDWGDVPRGVTLDKEIYLRNLSSTLTANTVALTFEDIQSLSTSNTWYTIKEAGGAFGSSLTLTSSISPSSNSPVITLRLTVADDEDVGLQEARLQVNVGSWT